MLEDLVLKCNQAEEGLWGEGYAAKKKETGTISLFKLGIFKDLNQEKSSDVSRLDPGTQAHQTKDRIKQSPLQMQIQKTGKRKLK